MRREDLAEARDLLDQIRIQFEKLEDVIFEIEGLKAIVPPSPEERLASQKEYWRGATEIMADESVAFDERLRSVQELSQRGGHIETVRSWNVSAAYCLLTVSQFPMQALGMHLFVLNEEEVE